MEHDIVHDSKCERIGVARAIAPKINLTRSEYQFVVDAPPGLGLACYCEGRVWLKFGVKYEEGDKSRLRRIAAEAILARRQALGGWVPREVDKRLVEGQVQLADGEVIEVDFRNRRRLR